MGTQAALSYNPVMAIESREARTVERVVTGRPTLGSQVLAYAEVLLLSVWIGSMVFFSFAVAPGAFSVLGTRHLAGLVVTSNIAKVEAIGLIAGALLILIQAVSWRASRLGRTARVIRLTLVIVMMAAAALSRLWVSPAMQTLRMQMGGIIDEVAADDPLRLQFNDLHQYSVGLMSVALFSGLVVLFLTVRSWLRR
jgi:hypothetical protein